MWPNIFGAFGIGISIIIYQQKDRSHILLFKLIADLFWMIHYLLLGAYSGCAAAIIAITRSLIFMNRGKKKWASHPIWLVIFLLVSALSAVLTWKNAFSLLPATASILSVLCFWAQKPRTTRFMAIPVSLCMLTYDVASGSYTGLCNEILTISSTTIAIIRYSIAARKEKNDPPKEG